MPGDNVTSQFLPFNFDIFNNNKREKNNKIIIIKRISKMTCHVVTGPSNYIKKQKVRA